MRRQVRPPLGVFQNLRILDPGSFQNLTETGSGTFQNLTDRHGYPDDPPTLAHVLQHPLRSPVRISHRSHRDRRARETSNYKGRLRRDVSHGSVRIRLHREALGGDVEDRGGLPLRPGIRQTGLQHRQPAPLHLRSAAPGARHRVLPDRLRRPLQEDEGIQRVLPPLLRRQRDPHPARSTPTGSSRR